MNKYHINPQTLEIGKCTAMIKCKFAENGIILVHYDTRADAQKAVEEKLAEKNIKKVLTKNNEDNIIRKQDTMFNGIIKKKILPSIYAFRSKILDSANSISAVKVGDTTRAVNVRLDEWRNKENAGEIYANGNLEVLFTLNACFEDPNTGKNVYVRDYNFHKYLEKTGHIKLIRIPNLDRCGADEISQEFYVYKENPKRQITKGIIEDALADQIKQYGNPQSIYEYYNEPAEGKVETHYMPTKDFKPRKFQRDIINKTANYLESEQSSKAEFLISAPTRSGKSFMAASTAKKMFKDDNSKKHHCAVVVSGFADIEDEWKSTFESHKDFNNKEYGDGTTNKCGASPCTCKSPFVYLNKDDLLKNADAVEEAYKNGADNVVVFLTLQDLAGSITDENGQNKKNKYFKAHDFLKNKDIDLVISDEAHYAAFNESGIYQQSINNIESDTDDFINKEIVDNNVLMSEKDQIESSKVFKSINPTMGKLFITATPFNVLNIGKRFPTDNNIVLLSKSDIWKEKEKWDAENKDKDPSTSPYYGLVNEKTFCFDLGAKPNELFSPKDIQSNQGFRYPEVVRNIISGLFGKSIENCPNILNNKDYIEGGLGKNTLMFMPTRSSCDAMETELKQFLKNNNLDDEYEIINISTVGSNSSDDAKRYRSMRAASIKNVIDDYYNNNKKTITISCNRFVEGVTLEKTDTVMLMRSFNSAQQYVQATGRASTPFIKTVNCDNKFCKRCKVNKVREEGKLLCQDCFNIEKTEKNYSHDTMKIVEKPNAAIISFDPEQTLNIQYEAALARTNNKQNNPQLAGANIDDVQKNLQNDLNASNIYVYNINKIELRKIEPTNILEEVTKQWKNKGVKEIAHDMSINLDNLDFDLKEEFLNTAPENYTIHFKNINNIKSIEEYKNNICMYKNCNNYVRKEYGKNNNRLRLCNMHYLIKKEEEKEYRKIKDDNTNISSLNLEQKELLRKKHEEETNLRNNVRNVYAMTLLYSVLSDRKETSLKNIIEHIEKNKDSKLLAEHLGINLDILKSLSENNVAGLDLDTAIVAINDSFKNNSVSNKWNKFNTILQSFNKFSANEIPTSKNVSKKLVDGLDIDKNDWNNFKNSESGTIDIGCKSAVNLVEFYEQGLRNGLSHEDLKDKMFSVPTSPATYELIKKVYHEYGWNSNNILYIEDFSNEDNINVMNLAMEYKKCQAKDPSTCRYHRNNNLTQARNLIKQELNNNFVDKINSKDEKIAVLKYFKRMTNMQKFDYCISNPPYQISIGRSQWIYNHFMKIGANISKNSIMITPSNYLNTFDQTQGIDIKLRHSKEIEKVWLYDTHEMFKDISVNGVAITKMTSGYDNQGKIKQELNGQESIFVPPKSKYDRLPIEIKNILKKFKGSKGVGHIISSRNPWDSSNYQEKNKNMYKAAFKEKNVAATSASKVLKPGEIEDHRYLAAYFNTREEAENFLKYQRSNFYQTLVNANTTSHAGSASIHNICPDLKDYSNNNPLIDWNKPLDDQLYKMFKLSPEDIAIFKII